MIDKILSLISHDIGIDLGTANTLVLVKGKGIVIRQPSIIARQKKTKELIAVGDEARKMIGRTPPMLEVVRPLKDGVIADFDATKAMLKMLLKEVSATYGRFPKIFPPKVVIGIPSGVTEVERRAVQEAALEAGARKAYLIEEPMAAAIGVGLPVDMPEGTLIVDIGGGTTEIAAISLGGIVIERCLKLAGDEMDEAITNFFRIKFGILLGSATAEEIKIELGSAMPIKGSDRMLVVRGRDIESGLPRSIKATSNEVREAIGPIVQQIVEQITEVIEETPPELVSDIVSRGITLCGGVSQLRGLDKLIAEEMKMPVWVADDPMSAVVRGCGKLLEDEKLLHRVRVTGGLR